MQEFTSIGKRIPKLDAVEKATGKAQYIQDLKRPGMLYGKILYSKYPHARITKIDTKRARKLSGVRAVLTGDDVPEIKMGVYKGNPPLKKGKVRSYRDEVAAVAATDPETAEKAIKLIEVTYESLPGIFDPIDAIRRSRVSQVVFSVRISRVPHFIDVAVLDNNRVIRMPIVE